MILSTEAEIVNIHTKTSRRVHYDGKEEEQTYSNQCDTPDNIDVAPVSVELALHLVYLLIAAWSGRMVGFGFVLAPGRSSRSPFVLRAVCHYTILIRNNMLFINQCICNQAYTDYPHIYRKVSET